MFGGVPNARADLKSGTLYALIGDGDWIYYGQVTAEKLVGFFHRRDRQIADAESIIAAELLAVLAVVHPSITRALRTGRWTKLGRHELPSQLLCPPQFVHWPVGTLDVTVSESSGNYRKARVDDPAIQCLERSAVWDAEQHIPARLAADFGVEEPAWHVGGPIWRERKVMEEMARRHPDKPWHQLPADWVPTSS
ncbi:MAG: hypothetical protein H2056_06405 [Sphingopyxis sp.]|nr:hypothetical protein [Sphingopyxis sp.]